MIKLFVGSAGNFYEAYDYLYENRRIIVDLSLLHTFRHWDEEMEKTGLKRSYDDVTMLDCKGSPMDNNEYFLICLAPEPIKAHLTGEVIKL